MDRKIIEKKLDIPKIYGNDIKTIPRCICGREERYTFTCTKCYDKVCDNPLCSIICNVCHECYCLDCSKTFIVSSKCRKCKDRVENICNDYRGFHYFLSNDKNYYE